MSPKGMSLVELMVSLSVILIVLAGATAGYLRLLKGFGTQSKIAERYMETLCGLELLRYDIEMAGFGLPFDMNSINYREAVGGGSFFLDPSNAALDDAAISANAIPRAFGFSPNGGENGSDVLAVKSQVANLNVTSKKWSIMFFDGANARLRRWNRTDLDFANPDRFIVLDANRQLQRTGTDWYFTFYSRYYTTTTGIDGSPVPHPTDDSKIHVVYGIDPDTNPRMPFQRVDYYLKRPGADRFPTRCAPNSFILYRGTINQADGRRSEQPVIDCVMDFQVAFGLDGNGDGTLETWWQDLNLVDTDGNGIADEIRDTLREVRVFVLYHEGQRDEDYFAQTLNLGDADIALAVGAVPLGGIGGCLSTFVPAGDDLHYRWKVAKVAVKPINME